MTYIRYFILASFFLTLLFISSCDTEDPFSIPPPDFSTVPQPFDTTNVESVLLKDGVRAYIHDEGYGPFFATTRDQVFVFMTLRTDEGEVIYSTFADDRTDPVPVTMRDAGRTQNIFTYSILLSYTPGLKIGLLGIREGEKRTLVVPPEQGFGNVPENHVSEEYKENTLIYDIRVSSIRPK